MKKLVMSALLFGCLQAATGCILVTDDDDDGGRPPAPPPGGTGGVTVTWEMLVEADSGTHDSCGEARNVTVFFDDLYDGADAAEYVFDLNADNSKIKCLQGDIAFDVDVGVYDVWIEFTNNAGTLIQQSQIAPADILEDGQEIQVDFTGLTLPEQGIALTWSLFEADGTTARTCADFPDNNGVSLLTTQGVEGWDDIWNCEEGTRGGDYVAATGPLPPGTYTYSPALIDINGDAIAQADAETTIVGDNEFTDIGEVFIDRL